MKALDASVLGEACPHSLTPTASTAVASALGDALAVAVLEAKGSGVIHLHDLLRAGVG